MSSSAKCIFPESGVARVRGRRVSNMVAKAIAIEQGWLKTDDNQTKGDGQGA